VSIRIVRLGDHRRLSEFIEFSWTVNSGDRLWVPPLRERVLLELSRGSAFSRYGRCQLFLCELDGRIAGRIAAIVNPRLLDGSGHALGQLGYFECVDEPAVAAALIDAGIKWLQAQQLRQVIAPMNGGAHRAHRFLTRGFDRAPFLFEPRNPPYYPALFEGCGFAPISRWFSYDLNREQAADRLQKLDRVLARRPAPGRIEELETGQSPNTIMRLHRLLDRCWNGHIGYASIDLDEFAEVFAGPLAIMGPGHVSAYAQDGEDVGFAFVYPDYAEDMRALDGHAGGWGEWLGKSRATRIVVSTSALVPEARRSSAAMAQVAWGLRHAITGGFEDAVVALVVEGWLSKIGEQTREYTLYARAIT
jgi:hypothetical protein